LDRGSILRPGMQNEEWLTQNIYHFDIDPWIFTNTYDGDASGVMNYSSIDNLTGMLSEGNGGKYSGYPKLSGILVLSDTNETSGGFECAVGFQHHLRQWCEYHEYGYNVADDDNVTSSMQKICVKKGSLIIFTRELPHNVYPNKSNNFRYAQYVRITPLSELHLSHDLQIKRQQLIKKLLPRDLDISNNISKELFMM